MTTDFRLRAVVAEDDLVMRRMLRECLTQLRFDVIEADNGIGALDAVRSRMPDIVVLDGRMPLFDGYQACSEIRALEGGDAVPIVIVTGSDDLESVNLAYDCGATDFVAKPVNWPLLQHRLRYIMRNARLMQALQRTQSANQALLGAIPDRILVVDRQGRIDRSLGGDSATTGATTPTSLGDLFPGYVVRQALACVAGVLDDGGVHAHEYADKKTGSAVRYFEARHAPIDDARVLTLIRDITEQRQAERQIHRLANFDPLTGLPNRQLFTRRCAEALTDRDAEGVAVLHVALDHFGRVNDTLGHRTGDEVLRSVATRLTQCVSRRRDTVGCAEVARFGGDEFVIYLGHREPEEAATALALDVIAAMTDPFVHGGHDFVVTPSIGISHHADGPDADGVEALLRSAATATQAAKQSGRNTYRVYAQMMSSRTVRRVCMETELRHALRNDEFEIHYQPKFNARTLDLEGAEALLRWPHPEQGNISPGTFIPLAEEAGLIVDVGTQVVQKVCRQIAEWLRAGLDLPIIALNVSGEEFRHGDPVALLEGACAAAGIDPRQLEVEITESVLLHDLDAVRDALQALRDRGFGVAVDDFGIGYSSLAYLQSFPLTTLKIDRAFVCDIESIDDEAAVASAVIALAKSLGLKVVAEGIETRAQLEWMAGRGCDLIQGFLLGKPMPAGEFEALVTGRTALLESV